MNDARGCDGRTPRNLEPDPPISRAGFQRTRPEARLVCARASTEVLPLRYRNAS